VQAMRGEGADEDIESLIEMRRQVGTYRRALAAHRSALVALTHPELEALGDNASGERFQSLFVRFEATLQEARDAREAIVGSFDVLIARGAHKTNRIMTVLTLTSVILLPGALLAAVMGMNFKVGLFANTSLFWVTVAVIIAIAPLTIGIAKRKDWL
jgi:Mg2+ and Co2+ transporter CorA